MLTLPVEKIWGVGERTAEKLHAADIRTCGEMQERTEIELVTRFGKFGSELFQLCRGIDHREVNPSRERKSLSNEVTFSENLESLEDGLMRLADMLQELVDDFSSKHSDRKIRECFVKLKFGDFKVTSAQTPSDVVDPDLFDKLLHKAWERGEGKNVRLIGVGIRFVSLKKEVNNGAQLEMF